MLFVTLVTLAIPNVIQQILSTLLHYVDTAMVGQLGKEATTAVSTTTTITWLVNSLSFAVGIAAMALVARAYGAKDEERAKRISGQMFILALIVGAAVTVLSLVLSPFIPIWMGTEESIRHNASEYFFIISIPFVFRALTNILGNMIQAVRDTRTPMLINLSANLLNAGLNYVFIYTFGMGVRGAAVATAISYVAGGTLMFIAYRRKSFLRWGAGEIKWDREIMKESTAIALPALFSNGFNFLGYVMFSGMVSHMGTTIFAAHSIAVAAEELCYMPGYGFRAALSTLVGNSLGEEDLEQMDTVEKLGIMTGTAMMFVGGLLMFIFARPLVGLFTSSTEVADMGAALLRMVALVEPLTGMLISVEGIFFGLGKTRPVFINQISTMWGIRILFTFIVTSVLHLSVFAVWGCMIADNLVKDFALTAYYIYKKRTGTLVSLKGNDAAYS